MESKETVTINPMEHIFSKFFVRDRRRALENEVVAPGLTVEESQVIHDLLASAPITKTNDSLEMRQTILAFMIWVRCFKHRHAKCLIVVPDESHKRQIQRTLTRMWEDIPDGYIPSTDFFDFIRVEVCPDDLIQAHNLGKGMTCNFIWFWGIGSHKAFGEVYAAAQTLQGWLRDAYIRQGYPTSLIVSDSKTISV